MSTSASPGHPGKPSPVKPREATRLESVDEIRQALQARRPPTVEPTQVDRETTVFRPVRRPPMALLCIIDDNREDGEWIRLRGDRAVIGRSEGDILIPHDTMISARHAELSRRLEDGQYRWYLTDLQSTNGTFVRVGNALLKHQQELLIGGRLYRFDAAPQGANLAVATIAEEEKPKGTSGWQSVSPADVLPSLVELTAKGEGQRFFLTKPDNQIGRNPNTCTVVLSNDPLVSPQHARIYCDNKGRWHVENSKSLNGTWLRIEEMALDAACQFQFGEQRFILRVL
jgi:pSer/pThr/pTyr-binding forkhead associated (FHA) protein